PRDHGDEAVHDIRRIHAPPHPHLNHSDVHLPLVEVLEGHRGRHLEERRMVDRPGGGHRSNRRLHPRPKAQDIVIRNRSAVHLDPLVEADEVWGRVQADAIAGFLKDGGRVCAHGTLAVRAGDVKDLQAAVGIPQQGKKPSDVVQAQLDPEPLETIEVLKGRVVIHRSGRANGPRGLKVARSRTEESNEAHTYISRMAIVHRMHPAERLRGRKSPKLHGKTIVLGVTGSIAAVETEKLAHESMIDNPAVAANVRRLRELGIEFVDPRRDEDKAKMADVDTIVTRVVRRLGPRDLREVRVLVVAGATVEPIDDVRVVTNRSSGGTGIELARTAFEHGADVELWLGRHEVPVPPWLPYKSFETTEDLASMAEKTDADICVVPAAVADFSPVKKQTGKIPSRKGTLTLDLEPT